jgi:beta-galactosidase
VLDLLIDSFGHIGNAQIYNDRKGLVGSAQLDGQTLLDWDVYSLPVDDALLQRVRNAPAPSAPGRPGLFFRAEVTRDVEADAYVDMSAWRKGYLWVNGHLLGRYWNLGPQQRLYCPAPWWRKGVNEILVLDFHRTRGAAIGGATSLHD